jgi:hypothetical protein
MRKVFIRFTFRLLSDDWRSSGHKNAWLQRDAPTFVADPGRLTASRLRRDEHALAGIADSQKADREDDEDRRTTVAGEPSCSFRSASLTRYIMLLVGAPIV